MNDGSVWLVVCIFLFIVKSHHVIGSLSLAFITIHPFSLDLSMSAPRRTVCTLGMFIIDRFEYRDEAGELTGRTQPDAVRADACESPGSILNALIL